MDLGNININLDLKELISKKLMKKLNIYFNKYFYWLIALIVILILLLGYYFVLHKQYVEINKTRNVDLVELNDEIDRYKIAAQSIDLSIDQSVKFTAEEEELLSYALPEKFDLPSFVIQIEALAKDYGFLMVNVTSRQANAATKKDQAKDKKISEAQISLNISSPIGDYDKLKEFLNAMEKNIMLFDINSINLGSFGEAGGQYQINLTVYYYPMK